MFKYNTKGLKKLEDLFAEAGYVIRYEKGNFNAGYCILESKKVVVINKYYSNEAKINCLIDILSEIEIERNLLSEPSRLVLNKVLVEKA